MIDRQLKRSLGQMIKGVQVIGASADQERRMYTSHWFSQIAFDEPIVLASVSPKHDTHPVLVRSGVFSASLLAGDQIAEGQYFSYPGRKFQYVAEEFVGHANHGGGRVIRTSVGAVRGSRGSVGG